VNATTTAISTLNPNVESECFWPPESPLTTTPVITLISGSAPSSFQRSGTPTSWPAKSGGRCRAMSRTTGRRISSIAKKRSITP